MMNDRTTWLDAAMMAAESRPQQDRRQAGELEHGHASGGSGQ
jgi:hypothetical protein